MKVVWIALFVIIFAEGHLTLGVPLTKWFKTDNNTYYIEPDQKFTWQQSYAECKSRKFNLLSHKGYNDDEILKSYLQQIYDPVPDFWLKSNIPVDLHELMASLTGDLFKMKFEDSENTEVIDPDNPDNCVLTKDGSTKSCKVTHGFICRQAGGADGVQNIQNIILKFS